MALEVKLDVLRDIKYIDWFYRSREPFTSSRGVMEELSPP